MHINNRFIPREHTAPKRRRENGYTCTHYIHTPRRGDTLEGRAMAEPRLLHACQRGRWRPVNVGGCAGAPAGGRRSRWRRPSLRLGGCGGGELSTRCGSGHIAAVGDVGAPKPAVTPDVVPFLAEIKRQTSIRRWGGLGYGRTQRLAMAPGVA